MADLKKEEICVLVPAYNEAANIAAVARAVRDSGYPVFVIDDGSTDETAAVARSVPGVFALRSPVNEGKGAAVRRGIKHALENNFKAVIMMDADGQHDPRELDLFFYALNNTGAGIIVGNRMRNPTGMPLLRRVTNGTMSWVLSVLTGQTIPDSQCGYRAAHSEILRKISLRTGRFEIESEMLLETAALGMVIGSVPIRSVYEGQKSEIHPFRDTYRFFRFLFRYFFMKK
jgi:glycosyltransferase involved in cell wall biosynthesis